MLKRILFFFTLALMASPLVFAQITTSSITGVVKNTSDEPMVGASVTATHLPSGTKYTTISRSGGVINIPNMQVGGPYLIEVSFIGFETEKYENVFLQLAESFSLNPQMKKTNATLENVVLTTGGRSKILNSNRTGSVTNIGIRQITNLPTINRSLNDFTRATPQSSGAAIGGGNSRQNNFTIDGSDFNNQFGIGGNLPAGGSPISLDAVDEISVNITPFDIRQSGFIGSAINAVTRSGTNSFSGSVYTYFRTEKQRGDRVEKTYFVPPAEKFNQKGVRFGGPIIKNKLFFFLNYETEKQPKTIQTRIAATTAAPYNSSPNIARPTADSLNYIRNFLLTNYGYETGPYDNYTPDIERKKIMGRIDWNISSKHRFNIRYSQVEGGEPSSISNSVTGTGLTNVSGASRTDNNALWFSNSNYFQGANFYSLSAELNSTFGKFANTIRGTYTYQNDSRETDSKIFPTVDIMSTTSATQSVPYTSFGYEPFSFGNLRKVKTYSIVDNFSWTTKKHSWIVGLQVDLNETINGFQRFATSYYRFATWADFESSINPNPALRKKPTDFALTYSLSDGFAPAFSAFKFAQYSGYIQDEIAINRNFKLTVGLRIDQPTYPSVPQILTHPLVESLTFENGERINTGNLPGKRLMWSPRIGFNWDLYGDRSLQIRGGTGIFTGKIPFVWIVSQSGDNGLLQVTQSFNSPTTVPAYFDPNPAAWRPATVPVKGTIIPSTITAMAPNFKNPQSWKSTLAMDTKLPLGIIASLEAIFNKDLNTAFFRMPNYIAPLPLNVAGYPDNRLIYGGTTQTRFINTLNAAGQPQVNGSSAFNPVIIDNGKRGYYFSITAKFEKPFSKGFFASVAYTKSLAGNLHDGTGDQPLGTYQGTQMVNGLNTPSLATANYVVPDRVIATISYRKEYFKHLGTTISALYSGSIDRRFSYVYGADFNRDGVNGNDLIYIPKDARNTSEIQFGNGINTTGAAANVVINGVTYTPSQQAQLFEDYINQDKYLKAHRGQYAERNGAQVPWRNQVDIKLIQDLFVKSGKYRNTFQFTLDIFNAGNLLNPSWGKQKTVNASSILIPQNPATGTGSLTPGGTQAPIYRLASDRGQIITRTFRDDVSIFSTYSMQFGLRYIFNN